MVTPKLNIYTLTIVIVFSVFSSRASSTTPAPQSICVAIKNSSPSTPITSGYVPTILPTPTSYQDRIALTDTDGPTSGPKGLSLKQVKNLLSNPNTPADQKVALISQRNTALDGSSMKIKPSTKNRPTATGRALSQGSQASFTQSKKTATPATVTFTDNATQQAYNLFIASVTANPSFIPLFRKLHIVALHEIYLYLMGIYTALTMTHIDDVKTYVTTEKKYALNKKTLIVTHLVNLIQAQLNSALQALFPGLPETYAIKSGMGALEQDSGSNLDTLVVNLEQSVMAVMGISTLSVQQIGATINEITAHLPGGSKQPTFTDATLTQALTTINIQTTATVADLQAALTVMNTAGTTFISSLTSSQTHALVAAFSILLASYTNTQTTQNLKAIIAALTNTQTPLTSQQMNNFKTLVSQCALGQQLTTEIMLSQQINQALQAKSSTNFTQDQMATLKSIVSYVLQNYEEQSLDGITQMVKQLGQLNPTAQQLSVLESLTLKTLASELLGLNGTTALPLASITDTQRFLLAYGLTVLSNQTSNTTTQQLLVSIAQELNNAPLTNAELTTEQTTAFTAALNQLANYTFSPLQAQDVGSQLTSAQQATANSAAAKLSDPAFTTLSALTQDEQLVTLKLMQEVSRVMETRLTLHRQQSSLIAGLFAGNTTLQNALFTSITNDQYQALSSFDKNFLQKNTPFSPADLAKQPVVTPDGVTLSLTIADALIPLFLEKTTNATPSYYSLLLQLDQQFFSDPALQIVVKTITPTTAALFQTATQKMNSTNFSLNMLDTPTQKALVSVFNDYLQQKSSPTAKQPTAAIAFQDPNQEAVNVVANTLFYTHIFTKGRTSFLATLQLYLQFFTLYTQTLQTPATPSYTGLTVFEATAKTVANQLQGTPIQSINPPLFFFNDATFRTIKILPKLAQLIDGTDRAPYPTFSIELAVNGSAVDSTGTTYQNQQSTGPITFNKFFFLDPTQASPTLKTQIEQGLIPAPEITGSLPSWITKTAVAATSKTAYPYLYIPNTELTGITGFYMNIPVFEPDPNNSKSTLIRLYEQPIIAQPAWLSASGWPSTSGAPSATNNTNNPSVLTLVRGCLGDFQSLLTVPGLFDPCLTIIFTKALATTTNAQTDQALTDACSTYISEKLADQQRQTSITTAQPGAAS